MAYAATKPSTKLGLEETQEQTHRIRIILSSKNVKNLEKVCADLVRGAKDKRLRAKGPESVCGSCAWCERQEVESEGTSEDSYQGSQHHHQEISLWRRNKHLGPI